MLARYDETGFSTVFAWCHVLERILSQDVPAASKALLVARKQNPHTEQFITGRKHLPSATVQTYSGGSKEEAMCFANELRHAWVAHPEALKWLEAQP